MTPVQGQMILGLGPDLDTGRFEEAFRGTGVIFIPGET